MIVTIKKANMSFDIKAQDKLKVIDALSVLSESELIKYNGSISVFSIRENTEINIYSSFEKNKIYNGDILEIKEVEK